jgi:ParB-like chromosome segregation protein Spo0J
VTQLFPWPVHPAADLFPLLGDDELRELADDIKAHGLHQPIWLYQDRERGPMLLDGRNRVRACILAGVPWVKQFYEGDDPIAFSISANEKRRHLTAGQRAFLALEIEKLYAAETRRGRPRKDAPENVADLRQYPPRNNKSVERAAKVAKASGRGVSQAKRVQQTAPDLAEKVKAGQLAIDRAERIIRDREAEQRRIAQARAEAAAQPVPTIVDIRVGDFRDMLAELENIDAVITDPPYGFAELHGRQGEPFGLLADLAAWADKALAADGILAVLMGQSWLPEVYRALAGGRPYRWTVCYLTAGNGYASMDRRVQSNWKPLLLYGGGPRLADIIRSEGTDSGAKSNHKWGQDYGAFHTIVERLTSRGQTVADPFMGSGTTLLAAHALGRHAIGCDIDAAAVATARGRLA